MKTAWLGSLFALLLLVACADRWFAFGGYQDGADATLGGSKPIEEDGAYFIGGGISGPIFPESELEKHERDRHPPQPPRTDPDRALATVDEGGETGEDEGEAWWQNMSFLEWIENLVLAALLILVGRHGEDVVKKTAARVKRLRREKTSPPP